ncbi:MAG: serine hydrolase domain-containing protein [Xanthobacteraceae bacterium]
MVPPQRLVVAYDEHHGLRGDIDAPPVPWWSVGKTAIAACALVLVARGRLTLDECLPHRAYTLRQLLQHTSGLGSYTARSEYTAAVERNEVAWTDSELLGRVRLDPFLFVPGTGWSYSNTGYFLIRRLIEQTVDADIDAALRTLVFSPLGIEQTRIARQPGDLEHCAWGNARGYHPGWVYQGLLLGPPSDAVLFMHRLMRGDLLPPHLRAAMQERRILDVPLEGRGWQSAGYGLGLMLPTSALGPALGHGGQGPGSTAGVHHFPDVDPPRTVAAFAPTEDQGVIERAVLAAAGAPEQGRRIG